MMAVLILNDDPIVYVRYLSVWERDWRPGIRVDARCLKTNTKCYHTFTSAATMRLDEASVWIVRALLSNTSDNNTTSVVVIKYLCPYSHNPDPA